MRFGERLRPAMAGIIAVLTLVPFGGVSGRHVPVASAAGKAWVCATVETTPTRHPGDSADDTAIWLNPSDRTKSTVIGVDKRSGGGLSVYSLTGRELFFYPDERLNNVDIRYNVPLGSKRVTLVGATNRENGRVDFWKVNELDGSLTRIGSVATSKAIVTPRGFALYHSPVSGKLYAFVTDRGHTDQYRLDGSSGQLTGTLVRQMLLHNATEGLVADDFYARVYVAEEDIGGVTRYGAEPGDPTTGPRIDTTTDNPTNPGHIVQDAKGLSMYYGHDGAGYIILASQGGNSFDVYDRGTNAWKGEFAVLDCPANGTDKVTAIDGLDVTNANLGSAFPSGMLATQDDKNPGGNQNYKYVPWQSIASGLGLIVDSTFDPRSIGAPSGGAGGSFTFAPTADAYVDATVPSTNFGADKFINSDNSPEQRSYLRFNVAGVTGQVTAAKLRVYARNGSTNGPAIYATTNTWAENALTWQNKPATVGSARDDLAAITSKTFVDYDVTALVKGNGTFNFATVGTSNDGTSIASREAIAEQRPALIITTHGG